VRRSASASEARAKTRAGFDRVVHDRRPQGGADLADAHGHALFRERGHEAAPAKGAAPKNVARSRSRSIEDDVTTVVQTGRLVQHTPVRARRGREIGKTYGLAVAHHVGSIIEVEAVAFPAHEPRKGGVRFNDTAGSMAQG
jgi:ATP-dependent Lon protease